MTGGRSHLVLLEDLPEGDNLRIDEALQRLNLVTDAEQLSLALGQLALPSEDPLAGVIVAASGDQPSGLVGEVFCRPETLVFVTVTRVGVLDGKSTYVDAGRSRRPLTRQRGLLGHAGDIARDRARLRL